MKKTINVTEEEVRAAFRRRTGEEKKNRIPRRSPRPSKTSRPSYRIAFKTRLARIQLEANTKQIDELTIKGKGEFSLEEVAGILGVEIQNPGVVKLQELSGVPAGGGSRANLNQPEFLKDLGKLRSNFTAGPYTDGEFIVYVSVQDVVLPGSAVVPAAKQDEIKEQVGRGLTGQFLSVPGAGRIAARTVPGNR